MYVSYDPEIGVTYVKWAPGEVARTVEISDLMMVDVDEHENPLGVEFLVAPPRISASMLERLAERFPSLKSLLETDKWMLTKA